MSFNVALILGIICISLQSFQCLTLTFSKNFRGSKFVPKPIQVAEHRLIHLNEIANAPDPLNFDQGPSRRMFKRQSSPALEMTTTSTMTDLLGSFGGETPVAVVEEVKVKPKPFTGVYYLVDWNTFLDVDTQLGRRVNLRFQPTIGDPKRFFHVTTP